MTEPRRPWLPLTLLGIALAAAGAALGEMEQVFRKAVLICLECIGIG